MADFPGSESLGVSRDSRRDKYINASFCSTRLLSVFLGMSDVCHSSKQIVEEAKGLFGFVLSFQARHSGPWRPPSEPYPEGKNSQPGNHLDEIRMRKPKGRSANDQVCTSGVDRIGSEGD